LTERALLLTYWLAGYGLLNMVDDTPIMEMMFC